MISSEYFPPQTGGIANFMASIARTLGASRICCLTGVPDAAGSFEAPYAVVRRPRAFARSGPTQSLALAAAVLEVIAKHRPSTVQVATVSDGYIALHLKRLLGMPFVVYAHGNEIAELAAGAVSWDKPLKALTEAGRVFAVSEFTAGLLKRVGVRDDRIQILHPGCDAELFTPRTPDDTLRADLLPAGRQGPILVTVGNLVQRKGQDVVIRALPSLLRDLGDVSYLIVGDGPFRGALEALAAELGVSAHVVFAGRVPRARLPDVYALSDIFVMPSRHRPDEHDVEGFGLVFLEAGACAKPVIGGRSGGIPDAVEDGRTGFLVDPLDPEEIAERVKWLALNRDRAEEMGRYARSRVIERFHWDGVGATVSKVLSEI